MPSMANAGKDTNASKFFISVATPLDGRFRHSPEIEKQNQRRPARSKSLANFLCTIQGQVARTVEN